MALLCSNLCVITGLLVFLMHWIPHGHERSYQQIHHAAETLPGDVGFVNVLVFLEMSHAVQLRQAKNLLIPATALWVETERPGESACSVGRGSQRKESQCFLCFWFFFNNFLHQ